MEGETSDPGINALRLREKIHLLLSNFIALGIPMITMGDEYGLTHGGNNNPYCHDGPINWFSWDRLKENQDFFDIVIKIIKLRKELPLLRSRFFYDPATDINWLTLQDHFVLYVIKNQYLIALNSDSKPYNLDFLNSAEWLPRFYTSPIPPTPHLTIPPNSALIATRQVV